MAALVWGISSVRSMVWPFQEEVLSLVILIPCLEPVSAGFLESALRLT
jgi:hypothetical protein